MKVEEIFVPIEGFEEYSVSNYGRVIETDTDEDVGYGTVQYRRHMEPRIYVVLRETAFWLDEIVAEAFFVDFHPGIKIYYKNGNAQDCTVLNLSFIEPKD